MIKERLPFLSIIIPTRNEVDHITACLESILISDYPADMLEILVVDGSSDDGTQGIVQGMSSRDARIRMLENPSQAVPHAMNIGIRAARGDLIVRMDAHAQYRRDYLSLLVQWMERLDADNVGGVVLTRPAAESLQAKAVAVILSHPFGMGNSLFRTVRSGGPVEVDTVPFGCYRREMFDRIGPYDELFIRNQDDELNARLKRGGGRIFLVPEIQVDYIARGSLGKLARMMYQYGYFKPLVAIKLGWLSSWRQLAPPAFVTALIASALLSGVFPFAFVLLISVLLVYVAINMAVCLREVRRQGMGIVMPLFYGFFLAHVAYGMGYLRGAIEFGVLRRHLKKEGRALSLSR